MAQPDWGVRLSSYFFIPQRIILAIFGFLGIVNAYTMRISLSIAITQLVVSVNRTEEDSESAVCKATEESTSSGSGGSHEWSEQLQGIILSAFYIGYIITHIPGGLLADKFGGKWTLGIGILSTAIFTLLTPLSINEGGATWLIILRILMGLGEGTTFPALSVLLATWVPEKERGKLGSLVLGGGQIGTILGNALSGVIIDAWGWEWVFYLFGALGVVWFFFFTFMCYSTPETHPFIKPSELEYLQKEVGNNDNKVQLPTPWKKIFTNIPMFALIAAQIGHDWGFYIMVSDLPKYMDQVMRFSIQANGLYSSLPYVMMWIVSLSSGFIGDYLISRGIMNTTNVRKLMTGIAAFGPAIFMVSASYAGCDKVSVVILFTICMGLMGAFYAGMKLSPLDMSPNFAGILMAITNGIGAITGVITPYLVGVMAPNATLLEWRLVFWVAFGVLCVTALIYCIWASGEIQDFNYVQPNADPEKQKQKQKDNENEKDMDKK